MSIRLFTALTAGCLCALAGMRQAFFLRREALRLNRWAVLLDRLSLLLSEAVLPLPDVLESAADGSDQPDMLLRAVASNIKTDPLLTIPEAFSHHCTACAERDILLRMAEQLSRGSAESRSLASSQAGAYIRHLAEEAAKRAARDARLWQTLGWTGGACLALMLM